MKHNLNGSKLDIILKISLIYINLITILIIYHYPKYSISLTARFSLYQE